MPKFSNRSTQILSTCRLELVMVFSEVVKTFDCTVISGYRGEAEQNDLVQRGLSKLKFPNSKHNCYKLIPGGVRAPDSKAVDVVPYPINWHDRERMTFFAGFVLGVAHQQGIALRWGGDWDGDWQVRDNNFDDLAHFELRD